jgi:hypothetical protein
MKVQNYKVNKLNDINTGEVLEDIISLGKEIDKNSRKISRY